MHDRCGVTSRSVVRMISEQVWKLPSRVLPPAPKVTDTKLGRSTASFCTVFARRLRPKSVLGGKNSKEKPRVVW